MKQWTHTWPSVCSWVFVNKGETVRSPSSIWTFHCIFLQSRKIHKKNIYIYINVCFHAHSFLELVEKTDTAFNFKCAVGLACKNKIWAWSNWVQTVNSQKKLQNRVRQPVWCHPRKTKSTQRHHHAFGPPIHIPTNKNPPVIFWLISVPSRVFFLFFLITFKSVVEKKN